MTNVSPSKKIHSVEEARIVAKKRVPKLMFDFVDGASGDEKLCENNSKALDQIRLQPKVLRNVETRIIHLGSQRYPFGIKICLEF